MKTVYLTSESEKEYNYLASIAREVEEKLQLLVLETAKARDIPDNVRGNILHWVARAETFRGLSYFLTPQSEWQGGESWKVRAPHICNY